MLALALGFENALDFPNFDIAVRIQYLVVLRSSSDPLLLPLSLDAEIFSRAVGCRKKRSCDCRWSGRDV